MTWVLSFRRRRLAEHRARLPAAFRPKTVSSGRTAAKIDRPLVLLSLQPPDRGSGTMVAGRDLRANGREMIGGGRDWLAGGHQRVALARIIHGTTSSACGCSARSWSAWTGDAEAMVPVPGHLTADARRPSGTCTR